MRPRTSAVNAPGTVDTPTSAVGLASSTASRSVLQGGASCANGLLWCCSPSSLDLHTRPLLSTKKHLLLASSRGTPCLVCSSAAKSSPMPVPASPAPRNSSVCSSGLLPVRRHAARSAASVTHAVPSMSSLKHGSRGPNRERSRKALPLPKSSNCSTARGAQCRSAATNSETSESYRSPRRRLARTPLYPLSRSRPSLSVPTSSVTGQHRLGSTPATVVYSRILPSAMPMPPAPRSPRPRMRSPSVTTHTRTSLPLRPVRLAHDPSLTRTWPRSSGVMYSPCSGRSSVCQAWHAAPTPGV
mmetsp:Transcript_5322/g.18542  ORF Transcript_5322/g.18542 Transcript_5322/m.18542 type:complete len:300 (-) Transcript_5322:109-1008(-)